MVLEYHGEIVCDIPLGPLADDAPLYERPYLGPDEYKAWAKVEPLGEIPNVDRHRRRLAQADGVAPTSPAAAGSGSNMTARSAATPSRAGGDAAVVRVHGTDKALAMTTDCTPRYCYADPYEGGKQAIAEA